MPAANRFHYLVIISAATLLAGLCAAVRAPSLRPHPPPSTEAREAKLQTICREIMRGKNGSIIVMDPRTGRVIAIANAPLALGQAFPAGSTLKIFTALAALETGLIDEEMMVRCPGRYSAAGFTIACAHSRDDPRMNLRRVLTYSCNYYFATLGERMDPLVFRRLLEAFGFGRGTGMDPMRESAGRLALEQEKIPGRAAIGESPELLVTPIQLITAFSAVANGGRLYSPHESVSPGTEPPRIVPCARSLPMVHEALETGAQIGTSRPAALPSLSLTGKTGTPTVVNHPEKTHGWFIGAAPAEDPQVAVLVFVGRGRGGLNAAPIAARIFAAYFESKTP